MGSTSSSLTTDIYILSALKKINILEVFPEDRSAADTLIAIEATNVLKSLKKNVDHVALLTPGYPWTVSVTPTSSQICLTDNYTRSPSTLYSNASTLSVVDTNIYPLLSNHNNSILYCVLLPHDIFWLEDGSDVVLVVDKNLHSFDKNINQYLEDHILFTHSQDQEGLINH